MDCKKDILELRLGLAEKCLQTSEKLFQIDPCISYAVERDRFQHEVLFYKSELKKYD